MHKVTSSFEQFRDGRWVHFSKLPQLTINPQQFHQDPAGYYLFPESFQTEGSWHRFPYRLEVKVNPKIKVLDIGALTFSDIQGLIEKLGFRDLLNDEYLNAERSDHDNRDRFWDIVRMRFMGEPGKFNKTFRRLGYDAIFDDDQVIHNSETQLMVLNPRMVTVESIEEQKASGYDEVMRVLELLAKKFGSVGKIEMKKPKQKKGWGTEKTLTGELTIRDGDKYVTIDVHPWFVSKDEKIPETIQVVIKDSARKWDDRSFGITLRYRNFDNEIHKLTNPKEDLVQRINKVFGKESTSSVVPIVQPDFLLPDHETDFPFTTLEQTGPLITYDAQPMDGDPETYLLKSFVNDFAPIITAAAGEPHVSIHEDNIEALIEGKGHASGQVMGDYEWWFQPAENDAAVEPESMPWNQIGILEHVEVDPKYRREGVGSALVKAWIKGAKKAGAEAIFLNASPMGIDNRSTIGQLVSFYKALGFKTWEDHGSNQVMFLELKKKARSEEVVEARSPSMDPDKMFKAWYALYAKDEGLRIALGIDPRDDEKIDKKVARRWFDMRMKRVKRKLDRAGFRQGVIAYRCMTVTDMWKEAVAQGKLRATGGHWTLDRELAPNLCGGHGGKRNRERNAILEAYIPFTEFDVLDAFNPSWSEEWEEFEISPQTYVMMMRVWNGDFTKQIYEYPMPTKVSVYAPNYVASSKALDRATGTELKRHIMDTLHPDEFDSAEHQEEMANELAAKYPEWELHRIPVKKLSGYTAPFAKADQDIQRKVKEYLELHPDDMPAVIVEPDERGRFYVRDGKHRLMVAKKLGLKDMLAWLPVGAFDKAQKAQSEYRAFAKATLPEDSELMEFYYMADAEAWREQQAEEFNEEWERMDEQERQDVVPDLRHEGYPADYYTNPDGTLNMDEVKSYWMSMRERQERDEADSTETFFENPRIIRNPTLIRFTKQPLEEGEQFRGYAPNNLGLTFHYTPRPGDLSFAFDNRDLKNKKQVEGLMANYGHNVYKFTVPYAVKVYHNSDYEEQVVFDVNTVRNLKRVELPTSKKKKTASAEVTEAAGPNLSIKHFLDVIPYRDSFYDLYPGYSKEALDPDDMGYQEYKFDDKSSAMREAREMIAMFKDMPDPIPVYRCISVKKEEDIDLDCPGTSWSWEKQSAIAFAKNHGLSKPLALLTGKVRKKDVDWYATVSLYYVYSGGSLGDSENEIRVDRSCGTVQDISVEWVDEKPKKKRAASGVATAKSEEIEMFIGSAGMGYYSYDYLMSEKADSMWAEQQQVNEEEERDETREEWARREEEFHQTSGDPSMTFGDAERVPSSYWLIHFTDADPYEILENGFRGRDMSIIGLTTYYKAGAYEGNLALAYRHGDIPIKRYAEDFGKYGKNAVIFKAKDAARAWHNGDEENQTVFDVRGVKSMYPVFGDRDTLTLYDPKKKRPITEVGRNNDGLDQIIDRLNNKNLKPDESVAEAMALAAPKKKSNIDFTSYGEGEEIPEEFVKLIPKTDALRNYINRPDEPIMLKVTVTVDGKPAGVGTLEDPSIHGLHLGDTTIVQVFVSTKARGLGIGSKLMELLEEAKDTTNWAGYTNHSPGFKHLAEQYGVRDMDDAGKYDEDDPRWQDDGSYDDSYDDDEAVA